MARGRAALLALAVAGSCLGPPRRGYVSDPGPYDRLTPEERAVVRLALAEARAGRPAVAAERLEELLEGQPYKIVVAVELQELQLRLLAAGEEVLGLEGQGDRPAAERLRVLYAERAEQDPSPTSLVLAARLETDGPSALRLLDRAVELDPTCIWAHYGRAHVLFAEGEFRGAIEAVDDALDLDSGHLPSRRLEVRTSVEAGDTGLAAHALRRWTEDAAASPFVSEEELRRSRADLAILRVLEGREGAAVDLASELLLEDPGNARALLARAAARFGLGDAAAALRDAQAALALEPDETTAAVQRALVVEAVGDVEEAAAAWADVLDTLERSPLDPDRGGMGQLVVRLQARVRLQRLEREIERERRRARTGP